MYVIRLGDDLECRHRFLAFLKSARVEVDVRDGDEIHASISAAASPVHERREIEGYVRTWNALNPGCLVTLAA